jgi:adenylosuccinate synthase
MPTLSVFGAQWGDEGKGKIIDRLAGEADFVVRYQGGANAGHTVVVGDQKYILHLIPSGILHRGKVNVIGNGVAVDPLEFLDEVSGLRDRGVQIDGENLRLSAGAHVIFEHHRRIDQLGERWLGDGKIGTTGRGIGPAYGDKARRSGLRVADLLDPDRCRARLGAALAEKNAFIQAVHGAEPMDLDTELDRYISLGSSLTEFVCDTGGLVRSAYRDGKRILFEGAQGVMLDIDLGTYPYVTSSNTGPNGIPSGAAFPVGQVEHIIGIAKAYCTRVGEGPFPTEEHGETGEAIRKAGNEFGSTTGRPRRCGWFDTVAVRYSTECHGTHGLVLTNLDVLSGFKTLKVGVAYEVDGKVYDEYPAHLPTLEGMRPHLHSLTGWDENIENVRRWEDLPERAREYVEWLEKQISIPIVMLSVGPERDQVIPRGLKF